MRQQQHRWSRLAQLLKSVDGGSSHSELNGLRLDLMCESERAASLASLSSYYYGTQYNKLKFTWDGHHEGHGDADIKPGWHVPLSRRKPSARIDIPRMIVGRLTAMMLGEDGWPDVRVEGDDDAQDYVAALSRESKLQSKFGELRDRGGSCGTAVASFSFVNGKPRVAVHDAAHINVLEWADRYEKRPARVLEVYPFEKTVILEGRPKKKTYYYARYWDMDSETIWDPIPEEDAKAGTWGGLPRKTVVHGYNNCPVYWCQNRPDSMNEDGYSDYYNLTDDFDGINRLMSATMKGTIANVDPTLIIKDDPSNNPGNLRKGSENAIFSKGGAEYLELRGDSIKTSIELAKSIQQTTLDAASVLIPDIEYISARAQSAAALRMVYQPMVSQCDILRIQYGEFLKQILSGMLAASKMIENTPPGPVEAVNGQLIQQKPTVNLSPRITYKESESGQREVAAISPRNPGSSEFITLHWPVYFKPTHQDLQMTIDGVTAAIDKTISQRSAVQATATMFGITDIDQELKDIEADKQRDVELQGQLAEATAKQEPARGELGENKPRPAASGKSKSEKSKPKS